MGIERRTELKQPVVTQWHPDEGCEQCKQAERIMHQQIQMSMNTHGLAMKKIRSLTTENAKLKEELAALKEEKEKYHKRLKDILLAFRIFTMKNTPDYTHDGFDNFGPVKAALELLGATPPEGA